MILHLNISRHHSHRSLCRNLDSPLHNPVFHGICYGNTVGILERNEYNTNRGHSISTYIHKIHRKTYISHPLIRTRTCAYQRVRNVSFSENCAYVLNEWSHTYHRSNLHYTYTFNPFHAYFLFLNLLKTSFS